jgi:hypothetical protein
MHRNSWLFCGSILLPALTFSCASDLGDLFASNSDLRDGSTDARPGIGAEDGSPEGGSSAQGDAEIIPDGAPLGSDEATIDAPVVGGDDATPVADAPEEVAPSCSPASCGSNAHCAATRPGCACDPGYVGDGSTCDSVAADLEGKRLELPCLAPSSLDFLCRTNDDVAKATATVRGDSNTLYGVKLHFRGIVELENYAGGRSDGPFRVGGAPQSSYRGIYRLEVSDPAETYFLNDGNPDSSCRAIDYARVIPIRGGASVVLSGDPQDHSANGMGIEIRNQGPNGNPIPSPAGVPPADHPFNGQFLQIDVVGVEVQ